MDNKNLNNMFWDIEKFPIQRMIFVDKELIPHIFGKNKKNINNILDLVNNTFKTKNKVSYFKASQDNYDDGFILIENKEKYNLNSIECIESDILKSLSKAKKYLELNLKLEKFHKVKVDERGMGYILGRNWSNIKYIKNNLNIEDYEIIVKNKIFYIDNKLSLKDLRKLTNFINNKNKRFLDNNYPNEDKVVIEARNCMDWLKKARNYKKN